MGRTSSRPAPSPPVEAPVEGAGKRLDEGGRELPRKKTKVTVSKCPRKAAIGGWSERAHNNKGKEPTKEAAKSLDCLPTMRELCEDLHIVGALINRLHDVGRVVHLLTEKNSALRAENKVLKLRAGPEVVAAVKKWSIELSTEVERLKTALGEFEQHCKNHELAADSAHGELKDL
ncbi:hypothetical protein B296_00011036 [Ensete ventricosum]|uniref:Uncharacterized protein n=1 Tax=Ensete ventricosum TaxID=4639 RepID=A0A427A6P9_ENSVE|nr:hypothetical protein B296_00011036 [Ensete ventricosum]